MEQQKTVEKTSEKKTPPVKRKNVLKKLDVEAARLLQTLKEKANKKTYGRKIRDSEIIAKALTLMDPNHLQDLQESTLTEKDRLHMAHESFQKANGKLSMDQFIGRLLKGEIKMQALNQ